MEPATNQSSVTSFSCWTHVLGDENTSYTVFLNAWATHTTGELQVYPDDSMVHALAHFPLGHLDTSIILTENVITVQTSVDSCSFQCESKQQQLKWLKVLRYPMLSSLPINNSKGWKWPADLNNDSSDTMSHGLESNNVSSQKTLSTVMTQDAKIQGCLHELQELNRKKLKAKEEQDVQFVKKRENLKKIALRKHKERLLKEGREEELNWTKETKNMYKTLGVESPSSSWSQPSLYAQQLKMSKESPQEKTARLRREAQGKKKDVTTRKVDSSPLASPTRSVYTDKDREASQHPPHQQTHQHQHQHLGEHLFEESSIGDLSQLSSQVREMLDTTSISYNNVLIHTKGGHEQLQACIRIQAVWRGYKCRNIQFMLNTYYAVTIIQKAWLLYKYRRIMKQNLQQLLDNKREMNKYYRKQEQTNKQKEMLSEKAKKKSREKFRLASCVIIQIAIRTFLKRLRIKRSKALVLSGEVTADLEHEHGVIHAFTSAKNSSSANNDVDSSPSDHKSKSKRKKKKEKKKKKRKETHTVNADEDTCAVSHGWNESSESVEKEYADLDTENEKLLFRGHTNNKESITQGNINKNKDYYVTDFKQGNHDDEGEEDEDGNDENRMMENEDTQRDGDSLSSSSTDAYPSSHRFQEAVRKVIVQQNVLLNIFDIDESNDEYSDEVFDRRPHPPPRAIQPSHPSPGSTRGQSFRRLLSS